MQKVDSTDSFFIANPLAMDNADLNHPTTDEQLYSIQPVTREGLEEFLEHYKEIVKEEKVPLYKPPPEKYNQIVNPYPNPDSQESILLPNENLVTEPLMPMDEPFM